jgi:hypothetical protein
MIRRKTGIYALYRRDKLHYVGLASSLMGRLRSHLRDRHRGLWDRFSVYLTSDAEHIKELESLLIRIVSPDGNRLGGRLAGSEDLRRSLSRMIKDADDDRRALLLGGVAGRRRIERKMRGATATTVLAGLVERRMPLIAQYRNKRFKATLLRSGFIRYRGKLYENPRAAARAAMKRPRNGWSFWRFKDHEGNWVKLAALKGRVG